MPRTKQGCEPMRNAAKKKIEAAALPMFAKKGFSISVNEIAAAAGVSKGLLYRYYPSKEALIVELTRQIIVISEQSMKAVAETDESAVIKIKRVTAMMCEMFSGNHMGIDYFMFMAQVGMSGFPVKELVYDVYNLSNPIDNLARIISEGQAEGCVINGAPEQLAMTYWATVQGLCCYVLMNMPLLPTPETLLRVLLKEKFI